MNIIIAGPQGSGKGTQAELLAKKFGLFYFSMGDFLRELGERKPDVAQRINKGILLPDEEADFYVKEYLEEKEIFDNIVFDGYPRSTTQYQLLRDWLRQKNSNLDLLIVLNISKEETVKRLSARRMDPETGKIYNLITNPPPAHVDINSLLQREDDKPAAIRARLDWYLSTARPMIEKIRNEVPTHELDGARPIDVIFNDIVLLVEAKDEKNLNQK